MRIEPYQQEHFETCMQIIQSNTPKYILPIEHLDYKKYLLRENKTYFVFFKLYQSVLNQIKVLPSCFAAKF